MGERLFTSLFLAVVLAVSPSGDPVGSDSRSTARSFTVTEKEVEIPDGATRLQGTLYLPDTPARSPAVILLGGGERGPRVPMKRILATRFAQGGIAALIYDSPGTGQSTGNALLQTKKDRVREALALHRFLRAQEGIHPQQVGIFGISEGAGIALLAAAEEDEVAFALPISGGLGVPPMEVSRYRIERMGWERGFSQEDIRKALVLEEILYALLTGRDLVEWPLIRAKVRAWPEEPWVRMIELTKACRQELSGEEKKQIKAELKRSLDTWKSLRWFKLVFPDIGKYEQIMAMAPEPFFAYLKHGPFAAGDWHHNRHELCACPRIRSPVLAIWGERDLYVPVNRSAAVLGECLSQANNDDVTLTIIPGASHRITIVGKGLELPEGYMQGMVDWILARFPGAKAAEDHR